MSRRSMDLYKLTFPNGKAYIGITVMGVDARFRAHRQAADKGVNQQMLYRAWRIHGTPQVTVLATFETIEALRAGEAEAVIAFGTLKPHGYNMTPGGDANPMDVPEIAKRVGLINRGRQASAETKAKLSALRAGKLLPEHHRVAISEGQKGRVHGEETRRKIAAKARGRQWTQEQRQAASIARKGKAHPNYSRNEVTKQRQTEAAKQRWARLRAENPEAVKAAIAKQAESLRKAWARRKGAEA